MGRIQMPVKKVLHIIPTLLSGGAERQLVNLVSATDPESLEHVICVIGDSSFFGARLESAGNKVFTLGITRKHPFMAAARRLRRIIDRERPDILHSWLYDANVVTRFAILGKARVPLITSLQLADYDPEAARIGHWDSKKVLLLKTLDKVTAAITKPHFVACSRFVSDSYKRHFGLKGSRMSVIYNSVDRNALASTDEQVSQLKVELGLPTNAFVYLNVGRLDPQKNHRTLFEAFSQAAIEATNAILLVAGVGHLDTELKRLSSMLNLNEKIIFLGRRNDIGTLLGLADVFVFPSFFEGLPVALVEAMYKALPCIASRIPVFEEILKDNESAMLVNPRSVDELSRAMLMLYGDEPFRRRLGLAALKTAERDFDMSKTSKQWEELYMLIAKNAEA